MNSEKVEFGHDKLFMIKNNFDNYDNSMTTFRFGNNLNNLNITINNANGVIDSICCFSSDKIKENDIKLPNIDSLEMNYYPTYFTKDNIYDELDSGDFVIVFNNSELNIIFDDIESIKQYYKNDRVTYYFDDNYCLVSIKIDDIQKNEYDIIKKEMNKPGSFVLEKNDDVLEEIRL